jgi:flavin-dependent dehydrogenase
METVDFVVVGCGPAGATAAREAAAAGIETVVLEKDAVVGAKRVCAAGLRPGFCRTFDLPRELVHCDTPRLALFDDAGVEHEVTFGPGHTTTREELDGTMGALAARAGADVRAPEGLAFADWENGLMTTLQYRVYLQRPAAAVAYRTLELHYYRSAGGRQIVAWMFPKRDHLAIGLGLLGKMPGRELRDELSAFESRVRARLYPNIEIAARKEEGHLLYGGRPRPALSLGGVMIGGTAAGLVDATNGEGIYEAAMTGRIAADCVAAERIRPALAAARYARVAAARFSRRLSHRVKLMRFLERVPRRYGLLFEQLANTPRFADLLQKEDCERTVSDRVYLYGQALRFTARSAAVAGR